MAKLPIGVIGVGHLGSLHAKMLHSIPSAELVGVFDAEKTRADRIANEYRTKSFLSIHELLKNVTAVSIATPTVTHFEIAKLAIECGVHIFIEKPITHTTQEAEQLVRFAKAKGVTMQVGHIERFNPALLAIETYHLRPMFIESHRLAQFNPRGTDVAVVLDLMIHDIDIILSLVHSPVEKIEANGVAVVSDHIDIANARLQFKNGCVANVTASRISQNKMRKLRLFQRNAYISIDFSEGQAEIFRLVDEGEEVKNLTMMLGQITAGTRNRNIVYERPEIKEVNALRYELELFVDAVQNKKQPVVTGEDGLQALKVAHDIMDKINQQRIKF
ncbi:MAG: Gfo/Idh/MocA family oxidoreductase [Bacteroidota bacterium]|nr:Gfo/Idh/MocA family oxidoreductase [Bacteroidota bacterium]